MFNELFYGSPGGYVIENSLRFRGAQKLDWTPNSAPSTSDDQTFSVWVKITSPSQGGMIISRATVSGSAELYFQYDGKFYLRDGTPSGQGGTGGTAERRDPGAWYHVVSVTTNSETKTYVNNQLQVETAGLTKKLVSPGTPVSIGRLQSINSGYFQGYMSEFHFVDGQALDPTEFGEYNADGVWVPKKVSVANYGTNGFYLDFSDPANIGADRRGNGNNWTATGFELANTASSNYDWMEDSPTQNYATINPLYPGASTSNANLTTANATGKPTILPGVSKTVSVGGVSQTWDGTEAGWTYTGNVDFGQRDAAVADISANNLPAVTITNPSDHFEVITDTGANILTAAQAKFPNGLWWIKDRANASQHQFVDSVRGGTEALTCPGQSATSYVAPTGNSVAWCWAVPSGTVTNNDGTTQSVLSANTTAGFSIVTYSGTGSSTTVGHGLSQAPEVVLIKARANGTGWVWYTDRVDGSWDALRLDTNGAKADSSRSLPTDKVFNVINGANDNQAGLNYVAYCWHSVPGYSAFGSYTGNGTNDNAFVNLGFRPAFILLKRTNTNSDWVINDYVRGGSNGQQSQLLPNDTRNELNLNGFIDLLSNGFKIRNTFTDYNGTVVYAAFAEHPFGGSNISPTTAR